MLASITALVCFGGIAIAQFPPPPEGITLLKSKFHDNVTISYKQVGMAWYVPTLLRSLIFVQPRICETTPGVKSYSGYVHLPPGFLEDGNGEIQEYPINT